MIHTGTTFIGRYLSKFKIEGYLNEKKKSAS